MDTVILNRPQKTKKLIELPNEICRKLAVQAAAMGVSVKKLIENLVIDSVENTDDDALYAYLLETRPEGSELLSQEEQDKLMSALRAKIQ
ncbi:MAG: hypothetical protein HDR88_08175 [Bacteroides sp.]|nr:hypothetical protein [Bacteroides sp.]